jgi:hypothetical protein
MHEPINVKSPNNTSKWQMGFNSAFKGLSYYYKAYQKIDVVCVCVYVCVCVCVYTCV